MSRWILYPLVLVGCAAALLTALTVAQVANLRGRVVLQAGWILPTTLLTLAWSVFLQRRRANGRQPSAEGEGFPFYAACLGFLAAGALVFQLNQHSLGRPDRREAVVVGGSTHRDWGGPRNGPVLTVCTVTVESWRAPGRKVDGLIPCSAWGRIRPGTTKVPTVSELGLTGMEFIRVEAVGD